MGNTSRETTNILASYSTYKALYDEHKNAYDIVAEFINDAIRDTSSSCFNASELRELVREKCGILVPEVVIDTAAGRLDCLSKTGKDYRFDYDKFKTRKEFEEKRVSSVGTAQRIFSLFHEFMNSGEKKYTEAEIDRALMDYLLDDNSLVSKELQMKISAFIVEKCEKDSDLNEALSSTGRAGD